MTAEIPPDDLSSRADDQPPPRLPLVRRLRASSSSILRGILAISAGTLLAQVVTAVSSPVISRIYEPADLGIYTVIVSVASILGAVASLRWELATSIPDNDEDAHSIVTLGLVSALLTTTIGTAFLLLLGEDICRRLHQPQLMPWLVLAPLVAGWQACQIVLNQLAIRHRRYSAVGTRSIFRSSVMAVSQIGLGLLGLRAGGLVISLGAGNAAAALSLLRASGLRSRAAAIGRSRAHLRRVARTYRRFPLLLGPSALVNVLGLQLPVLLICASYGSSVAGWLGLTQSVLALPVALLGQAVGQVYLGELARSRRVSDAAYQRLFYKASKSLFLVGVVLTAGLILLGPSAFPVVFGENWRTSGVYAQALAPALGLQMLAVPMGQTLMVGGQQGLQLTWDICRLIVTAGTAYVSIHMGASAGTAIWSFSMASALSYLGLWLMSRWAALNPLSTQRHR